MQQPARIQLADRPHDPWQVRVAGVQRGDELALPGEERVVERADRLPLLGA
jgi:hypothetical protein